MEKALLVFFIAVFTACSSPLDKKVEITDWKETIGIIKSETDEYIDADYNSAGDAVAGRAFGAMLTENKKPIKVTYRQLLDEAKTVRLNNEKALKEWEIEMDKLRDVFNIKITSGKYSHDKSNYFPHQYKFGVIITAGDQSVSAVKGWIRFYNEKGNLLFGKHINEVLALESNQTEEGEIAAILDTDDNLMEAEALPFEKIKTVWEPSLILLKDGTRMEAPKKP